MPEHPGERLIERFEELHTGMRVVVRVCSRCAQVHRGMLTNYSSHLEAVMDGRVVDVGDGFGIVPSPGCLAPARGAVTRVAVTSRTLYEQVDQTPEEKRWERKIKRPAPAQVMTELRVVVPDGFKFNPRW